MSPNVSLPDQPIPPYTIETWPVGKPKKYERNARLHSPKQVEQLRDSFRKFGQVWPILVREDATIIAGHGRLEAAKAAGLADVRVIIAAGWTEEQCRAFGLLDNKVALNSEWDEALLGAELADLAGFGVDLGMLGFDPAELAALSGTGGAQGLTDPDEAPEPPVTPVAGVGDLWALGRHRLLCGDATKAEDTQRVLGGVKPHLMVTDPPYGVSYDADWRNQAEGSIGKRLGGSWATSTGKVQKDDQVDWSPAWALFPGNVAYVWHAGNKAGAVEASLASANLLVRAQIIWVKQNFVISRGHYHSQHEPCWYLVRKGATGNWCGDRKQSTTWQIANRSAMGGKKDDCDTNHSTQKPVECMKRPIENNSSPGQAVYDPFVGSGTTIIAAEMTGRSCHAIEIDPAYVDVCIKRWQVFVGEKAILAGDGRTFEEVAAERLPKAA